MNEQAAELDKVYVPTRNVVARRIEKELIIVPLVSGIGDAEDELYSLNETGEQVWQLLDGKRSLEQVVDALCELYAADSEMIRRDVVGLVTELLRRKIVETRS